MLDNIIYVLTNIHTIGSPAVVMFSFIIFFFFFTELGILTAHKFNVKHSYINNLTRKNISLIHYSNVLKNLVSKTFITKFL
jgi:hypothetical protein